LSRKFEYSMDKRSNVISAFWSWFGFLLVAVYLGWVTYGLIAVANCSSMILDFCDIGKIYISVPWIILLAPKTGFEMDTTTLDLLVTVSVVLNTITFYLVGMGLQKVIQLLGKFSKIE
jgi:hypothetical protein